MFSFIKEKLQKIYHAVAAKLTGFFEKKVIDQEALQELENILLASDAGIKTTKALIEKIKTEAISTGADLYPLLYSELTNQLNQSAFIEKKPDIIVMIGINGSGKTTCSAKIAHHYKKQGKKVLMIAADTFRAAAIAQLEAWATKIGVDFFTGNENQKDPSAVIFSGCTKYINEHYDIAIIDTAGRLQTKTNLMQELAKMYRTIKKVAPQKTIQTLLTIDGMLGQNSFDQARLFHDISPIDGIIITKMDGSAKGGIVFAITSELKIPIAYLSFGESLDTLSPFDGKKYVTELLAKV